MQSDLINPKNSKKILLDLDFLPHKETMNNPKTNQIHNFPHQAIKEDLSRSKEFDFLQKYSTGYQKDQEPIPGITKNHQNNQLNDNHDAFSKLFLNGNFSPPSSSSPNESHSFFSWIDLCENEGIKKT